MGQSFHKPLWHGFCLCGGERRAKTTPTPTGPGHIHSHTGEFIGSIRRMKNSFKNTAIPFLQGIAEGSAF
jgi:hypothetical protein